MLSYHTHNHNSCREHGLQLSALAANDGKIGLMGIVKETGQDDHHVLTFYEKYFRHNALYKDDKWRTYKCLGDRHLSMAAMLEGLRRFAAERYRRKGIPNEEGGDHHTQGGLLLFDATGNLRYVYEEEYGVELDMDLLRAAVRAIRQGKQGPDVPLESSSDEDEDEKEKERSDKKESEMRFR